MLSIPEVASQIVDQSTMKSGGNGSSSTIFVVGSKAVGKSTLIYYFLERSDHPKETLVLEYSYGRKTSQPGIEKSICHVWEYGGKLEILKNVLQSIPARGPFYYCVVVDLSKIKSIWDTLEKSLQAMKECYSETEGEPEVIIIGGKYDLFKNYDSEIKKFICTTIRSVALIVNAHLYTYSSNETPLARRMKEIFNSIGFAGGITVKEKNTNYTKPLNIPKGTDSWESIGVPASTIEQVKMRHVARIASEVPASFDTSVPQRSHAEPALDSLLSSKYDELRKMGTFNFSMEEYIMNLG